MKVAIDLIDATKVQEKDMSSYDAIGFASGIYAANYHQSVLSFAAVNLPQNKKVFMITTSAMNKDFSSSIMKAISGKNPDETDLKNACDFYKGLGL